MFRAPLLLFLLCFTLSIAGEEAPSRIRLENEVDELRMVVRTLRTENEKLRDRNEALISEVLRLRRMLTDDTPAPQPSSAPEHDAAPEPAPALPENGEDLVAFPDPAVAVDSDTEPEDSEAVFGMDILYVNPTWHYLIVEVGTEDGISEGDSARVLREGVEIATAKITAARAEQSIADIDLDSLGDHGQYPRAGDRLLLLPLR